MFQAYNPRCYLVVGRVAQLPEDAKKSFELFRTAQSAVQIVTFDEVRTRLQSIRDVLAVDDSERMGGVEIPEGSVAYEVAAGDAYEAVPVELIDEPETSGGDEPDGPVTTGQ
jgi:hypothetical protein